MARGALLPVLILGLLLAACDDTPVAGTRPATELQFQTWGLPNGEVGTPYHGTVEVTGGQVSGYLTVAAGALPPGLSLSGGLGSAAISGTPTAPGDFTFTLRVTDAKGATATRAYSIRVVPAQLVEVTTATLPGALVGIPYQQSIQTAGGTLQAYFPNQ